MIADMKILCSGDLHLGRISSRCARDDEDMRAYSVRETWRKLVDIAIDEQVQLLLLSGDIADNGSNQYEAMGTFEKGIARLAEHGIQVYVVSGNHDARTLPQIISMCPANTVQLLGRDTWEQINYPDAEHPLITVLGLSYPRSGNPRLPIETLSLSASSTTPVLAMAHADYLGTSQDYVAVNVNALRAHPDVDMWLFGHIHAPECLQGPPFILNPGTPQALDPGEPGLHGPWLLEIMSGHINRIEQVPLSSVVYCTVTADIAKLRHEDELLMFLLPALEDWKRTNQVTGYSPRVSCRITLTGESNELNKLGEDRVTLLQEQPLLEMHNLFIDQIDMSQVTLACDLAALRRRKDVIGTLAGMLLDFQQTESCAFSENMLRKVEELASKVENAPPYLHCLKAEDYPVMESLLQHECRRLLNTLLLQEEGRK